MPRTAVTVPTEDGACAATLHTPPDGERRPAVILYPDAVGARETFAAMADRLADLGYAVLLPDVYYRAGGYAPFDVTTLFSEPAERERLMALAASLTTEMIVRDAGAFLTFLADRPEVSGAGAGTTGYCMGGRTSLIVAGHYPDRVVAAASFHGGQLGATDDPGSPHLLADRTTATVYVAAAENDDHCPPEQHERLDQALTAAGVKHTIDTYPAAHGFAVPDNPTYDATAAERHWTALADLYAENLRS
ncbi:dienelactone hydrolase family protein [Amycolatopsis nigrescens]|uniref:dienelactone hydrolase family protein n=1 Tax=Amycolatopsis nigrescens TaxID=381445 RepID=UPI00036E8EFB|nr:dienelactone hydrolase family protein [Amycolatopsis nigrescens]